MRVIVFGARVRQARVLRRRGTAQLADSLGWQSSQVSRLEGRVSAELAETDLARLGETLGFPVEFFTTEPVPRVVVEDLLFRTTKRTTKTEQVYLAEMMTALQELIMVATQERPLPPVRIPLRRSDRGVAADAAAARAALRIPEGEPVGSLTMAAEKAGVVVVVRGRRLDDHEDTEDAAGAVPGERALKERHLGLSAWIGEFNDQPAVVTRATDSWERTRWTLAHEIGHLCLHRTSVVGADAEEEASAFASELLAPIEALREEVPATITLTGLLDLKLRWGISIASLLFHLARNRVIDAVKLTSLQRQLYSRPNPETGRTWGVTEPGWDARAPERPRMLMKWLENTLGTQSPKRLAALPGVVLPADVLTDLLAHQRLGPGAIEEPPARRQGAPELASVVTLASRR